MKYKHQSLPHGKDLEGEALNAELVKVNLLVTVEYQTCIFDTQSKHPNTNK